MSAFAAAERSGGAASTSGRAGHSRNGSGASDIGNVMGMPAAAAQWRSKGGFIGRPRARVGQYARLSSRSGAAVAS